MLALRTRLLQLAASCIWYLFRGGRGDHLVVLCYHGVRDGQGDRFGRQLRALGGRTPCVEAPGNLQQGGRSVCITFDDAFACLLRNALPQAKELGVPTTVFAVPGNLGAPPRWEMRAGHPEASERTMTAEELVAAEREFGCRIGSHTVRHRALATLSPGEAFEELVESKRALEEILGHPVEEFAAPYGSYDDQVVELARRAGYTRFYTLDRTLHPREGDGFVVGRYLMSPDAWWLEFWLTINGGYSWIFPLRRLLNRMRGISGRSGGAVEAGATSA